MKKKCLLCGDVTPSDGRPQPTTTCTKCGEATWHVFLEAHEVADVKAKLGIVEPSSDELPEDKEEAPSVPKKRGRR